MRCQIEKNKEILCDEIEKLGEQKMNEANAAKLSIYRGAYKALCMLDGAAAYAATLSTERHNKANHQDTYPAGYYDAHKTVVPLSRETAMEWAQNMENADGTRGPHWSMEQTEEYRAKRGIDSDPLKWWLAMNMIYSDYCKVADRVNANNLDFYVYMAKAFLDDKDAEPDKLARYYEAVVKK